jgi:hypothetical protein
VEVNIFCLEYYSPFKAEKGLVLLDKMKQSKRENKIGKRGGKTEKICKFPGPGGSEYVRLASGVTRRHRVPRILGSVSSKLIFAFLNLHYITTLVS